MKIRLYLEEDSMSRALVRGLRARNVDVVTALRFRRLEVDHQFELRRPLHWQIGGLGALQKQVDICNPLHYNAMPKENAIWNVS